MPNYVSGLPLARVRRRELFMLMCTLFAAVGLGLADDRVENVATFVKNKESELRKRLESNFLQQDDTDTLHLKETTDELLAPVLLLREIGDSESSGDLARVLRYSYKEQNDRALVLDESKLQSFKSVLETMSINRRAAVFSLQCSRVPYNKWMYPVFLQLSGWISASSADFSIDYCEPFLQNTGVEFPFYPFGLRFKLSEDSSEIVSPVGEIRCRIEAGFYAPRFNNPTSIYACGDTLALVDWLTKHPIKLETRNELTTTRPAQAPRTDSAFIEVYNGDGTSNRLIEFDTVSKNQHRINIIQSPLMLLHEDPVLYALQQEVDGKVVKRSEFSPSKTVKYMGDGRLVCIEVDTDDKQHQSRPHSITIRSDDTTVFTATYQRVNYVSPSDTHAAEPNGPLIESHKRLAACYKAIDSKDAKWRGDYFSEAEVFQDDEGLKRNRLKYNIYASLLETDSSKLNTYIKWLFRIENANHTLLLYNLEGLAELTYRFSSPGRGWEVVDGPLRRAYRMLSEGEMKVLMGRLVDQQRFGFALVALEECRDKNLSWTKALAKHLRSIITGEDKIYRYPNYPYIEVIADINHKISDSVPKKNSTLLEENRMERVKFIFSTVVFLSLLTQNLWAADGNEGVITDCIKAVNKLETLTDAQKKILAAVIRAELEKASLDSDKIQVGSEQFLIYTQNCLTADFREYTTKQFSVQADWLKLAMHNFIKLPPITKETRDGEIKQVEVFRTAIETFVTASYEDTPKEVRESITASVNGAIGDMQKYVGNYFFPLMLYPAATEISAMDFQKALSNHYLMQQNATRYGPTKALLREVSNPKARGSLINNYVRVQSSHLCSAIKKCMQDVFKIPVKALEQYESPSGDLLDRDAQVQKELEEKTKVKEGDGGQVNLENQTNELLRGSGISVHDGSVKNSGK